MSSGSPFIAAGVILVIEIEMVFLRTCLTSTRCALTLIRVSLATALFALYRTNRQLTPITKSRFLDHVIVGQAMVGVRGFFSFQGQGRLP